jgi:hypothetical protein
MGCAPFSTHICWRFPNTAWYMLLSTHTAARLKACSTAAAVDEYHASHITPQSEPDHYWQLDMLQMMVVPPQQSRHDCHVQSVCNQPQIMLTQHKIQNVEDARCSAAVSRTNVLLSHHPPGHSPLLWCGRPKGTHCQSAGHVEIAGRPIGQLQLPQHKSSQTKHKALASCS